MLCDTGQLRSTAVRGTAAYPDPEELEKADELSPARWDDAVRRLERRRYLTAAECRHCSHYAAQLAKASQLAVMASDLPTCVPGGGRSAPLVT